MNQEESSEFTGPTGGASSPRQPRVPAEHSDSPQISRSQGPFSSSKRDTLLVVIGTILFLTLAGILGYFFAKDSPIDNEQSVDTTIPGQSKRDRQALTAAESTLNELRNKIKGEQQQVDARTESGGTGIADGIVYSNATYKTENQRFATYPAKGYGFGTRSTPEVAISDMAAIESYMKTNGFAETPEGSGVFASKNIVCAVRLFNHDMGGFDGIGVGCGDMIDYAKNYVAALPFYYAYEAREPKPAPIDGLTFASPVVMNGADGYKNAHVSIGSGLAGATGGFSGLFYKAPNTTKWTYFMGTQNDISCDKFDTAELKKAFTGQRCVILSTGEESTVTSE